MKEVTPLFYYQPATPDKGELEQRIAECGLSLKSSELRQPGWTDEALPSLLEWHQEGSSIDRCVMWASSQMTEFRLITNHAAVPVPAGLAVLIQNQRVEHRMPAGASERWFYKGIVGG
jgi:hypothetical protein